jgi:hypothetical protein
VRVMEAWEMVMVHFRVSLQDSSSRSKRNGTGVRLAEYFSMYVDRNSIYTKHTCA